MTKCNFQSIRIYPNFPTITGWKCCQILTFCIRYIYIYILNDITITVYLWLLTSINNFLPELLKIRPSVSAEWQIRQVRRIGRVRQVPRIRRVRVHIRRIRVLKIASMEVYVENPAVLELILLYRATKYKQTKRPGC